MLVIGSKMKDGRLRRKRELRFTDDTKTFSLKRAPNLEDWEQGLPTLEEVEMLSTVEHFQLPEEEKPEQSHERLLKCDTTTEKISRRKLSIILAHRLNYST